MKLTKQEKTTRTLLRCLMGIVGIFVLVFIGSKLYPIIHGPKISIDTLQNGSTLTDPMIRISGTASFTRELIVNGESFALSPTGAFDEKLVLSPGYNLITVLGVDRYGKANQKTYSIMLDEPSAPEILTLHTPTATQLAKQITNTQTINTESADPQ